MDPTSLHELKTLILSFHPILVVETVEEDRVAELLGAAARELGLQHFAWSITKGLEKVPGGDPVATQWTTDPFQLLSHMEGMTIEAVYHLRDFGRHLDSPRVVRQFRDLAKAFSARSSTVVLTGKRVALPDELEHHAVPFQLAMPGRDDLRPVLRAVLRSLGERRPVPVDLSEEQTDRFLDALLGLTRNQARQAIAQAVLDDGRLDAADIAAALERKADILRKDGLLDYFPAEDNRFELGGFARLKTWLERARVGFSAEARELGLSPPRGMLLVGVQGCGKSLAARFVAREWTLPLLRLDVGRLHDKWAGETEKNFRRAVRLAESMAPTVLWIDEIEKAFAQGSGQEDGGTSRRMFGAFLTWLQEKRADVFVVATANDLSRLPPELMRKGRFDEIFFVDLPTREERDAIFRIHLERRKQDPGAFELGPLLDASEGFSGAEIEQAVVTSLYRALHEGRPLDVGLLEAELNATVPLSVSRMEDVARLRSLGRERFVPVA